MQETSSTRAMSTWRAVQAGARAPCPPCMAPVAPLFHPLPSYADAAGSSLHQRGENPAPHGWRALLGLGKFSPSSLGHRIGQGALSLVE